MRAGRVVWQSISQKDDQGMKLVAVTGVPDVDDALAEFPKRLTAHLTGLDGVPRRIYQRRGYKCWKLPDRTRGMRNGVENWLHWNDGDKPIRIEFTNREGEMRRWKLFARFGDDLHPRAPWDRPEQYDPKKDQYMPDGSDVWGCSYEALREFLPRLQELEELLEEDLALSYRYSIQRYGKRDG